MATYKEAAEAISEQHANAELAFKGGVEALKDLIVIENGFAVPGPFGQASPDLETMKLAVLDLMRTRIVRSKDERHRHGVTADDLFELVLPNHADPKTANLLERQARKSLTRYLWGLMQTGPNGWVQSRLADVFLMQAQVYRRLDPAIVAFVSDDEELVMMHLIQPAIDRVVEQTARMAAMAAFAVERNPDAEESVRRAMHGVNWFLNHSTER
jgi:hypothetical protein